MVYTVTTRDKALEKCYRESPFIECLFSTLRSNLIRMTGEMSLGRTGESIKDLRVNKASF